MFEFLQYLDPNTILANNPLAQAGLLTVLATSILYQARALPHKIWNLLYRRFSVHLEVNPGTCFTALSYYLGGSDYVNKECRRFSVSRVYVNDKPMLAFSPGSGAHWFREGGRFYLLSRQKEEMSPEGGGMNTGKKIETYRLSSFGTDAQPLKDFMNRAHAAYEQRDKDSVEVYIYKWGDWHTSSNFTLRSLDTITLKEGQAEYIRKDLNNFISDKSYYIENGFPYRRSYLLHGPPGTGKTSLVKALSNELKWDLYIITIDNSQVADSKLGEALGNIPPKSVVLFEDVDCVAPNRPKPGEDEKGLTLSGFLNAVDGVTSPEEVIMIYTSNHPESLDPAITRRGRIDVDIKVDYLNANDIYRFVSRVYPWVNKEKLLDICGGFVAAPCDLQELIKARHKTGDESVYTDLAQYLKPID